MPRSASRRSTGCASPVFASPFQRFFSASSGLSVMVSLMTRIVVIDPQPAIRAGLAVLLGTEPGLVEVGAAAGAKDGIELVERQRPDVVLLDGDDLALCRRLRALQHPPRVVLYASGEDHALAVTARVAGAD